MIDNKSYIRDTFSNYGYILLDSAADDPEAAWLKQDMEERHVKYKATGGMYNNWPEYKLEGPACAVFDVVYEYWDDGSSEEEQRELFDDNWRKI